MGVPGLADSAAIMLNLVDMIYCLEMRLQIVSVYPQTLTGTLSLDLTGTSVPRSPVPTLPPNPGYASHAH